MKRFYEFEDFRFDISGKQLLRSGRPVSLTPKAFDTLSALLEHNGELLTKEDLMNLIWPDTVVEESNLTTNIKTLRKALGDDAASPRFIETVPRRGYRFIADVQISEKSGISPSPKTLSLTSPAPPLRRSFKFALVFLIAGVVLSAIWFARGLSSSAAAPIMASPFASEHLSTNGFVYHALVTPDGKNVIYTNGRLGDQSIWLRHLETSNNVEIVPAFDGTYFGLAISPDGKFLYFVRRQRQASQHDTYRLPISGGIPTKIIEATEGWLSISPDGNKISFVRCPYTEGEFCSLWIADAADGKNQRKLLSSSRPIRIGDNEFSPDGRSIAFAIGQSQNRANEFGLKAIDLETGKESELTAEKFFNIKSLTWLPDKTGLLITASRNPTKHFRIWEVSSDGSAKALTNIGESYNRLSLSSAADLLISTQSKQDFQLSIIANEGSERRSLTDASHVGVGANGRIFVSSIMSGNDEIWSMNPDGSDRRQLTNDPADDAFPIVSNDGSVFFMSNRTGRSQIWRMNPDGTDQVSITSGEGGQPVSVSSDGDWVYYQHGLDRDLWRVRSSGGGEELALDIRAQIFAVSPDASKAAYLEPRGKITVLVIRSLRDGSIFKTFEFDHQTPASNTIQWTSDSKSIAYVLRADEEKTSLWLREVESGRATKIADLGQDMVNSMAALPDGKGFAIVQGNWKHDAVLITGLR